MQQLSLFGRVLFVDWHGVVSRDPFWLTILENTRHPLNRRLEKEVKTLFSDNERVTSWMLGRLSSAEVSKGVACATRSKFAPDFLTRRIVKDCTEMRVNVELMQLLRSLRPMIKVVLATDNMDCFATALRTNIPPRRRSNMQSRLRDWAPVYDAVLCSSDIGVLKAKDPQIFFGDYLARHELSFNDAMLIDDRADNCAAFVRMGGAAVQWKLGESDLYQLCTAVHHWLACPEDEHPPAQTNGACVSPKYLYGDVTANPLVKSEGVDKTETPVPKMQQSRSKVLELDLGV